MITQTQLRQLPDEELCLLARDGCKEAEEMLVERYWKTVKKIARPYFLAGGDSEDLIQEGMLGLVNAIREYDGIRSSFQTFLTVCVKNRIYSAIRYAHGKKNDLLNVALSFEQLPADQQSLDEAQQTNVRVDPETFVIDCEEQSYLRSEIARQLSSFEAKVLNLYLEGFSYSEMSEQLNRSVKSIDNAIQRIRKKLAHLKG